jgi:hypothetical protein
MISTDLAPNDKQKHTAHNCYRLAFVLLTCQWALVPSTGLHMTQYPLTFAITLLWIHWTPSDRCPRVGANLWRGLPWPTQGHHGLLCSFLGILLESFGCLSTHVALPLLIHLWAGQTLKTFFIWSVVKPCFLHLVFVQLNTCKLYRPLCVSLSKFWSLRSNVMKLF